MGDDGKRGCEKAAAVQQLPWSMALVGIHLDKAVLRAELQSRIICFLAVLQHFPAVEKLTADIQRADGIPDQVRARVGRVVIRLRRGQISIVHCGVGIDGTGPQFFQPEVLISSVDSEARSCL